MATLWRLSHLPISEIAEAELLAALRACRLNLAGTAARLRVSRTSLYALVERHGAIRKAADLSRGEIAAALERSGGDLNAAADDLRLRVGASVTASWKATATRVTAR